MMAQGTDSIPPHPIDLVGGDNSRNKSALCDQTHLCFIKMKIMYILFATRKVEKPVTNNCVHYSINGYISPSPGF